MGIDDAEASAVTLRHLDELDHLSFADSHIILFMTANVGSADRLIRIILGMTLLVLISVTSFGFWADPIAAFGLLIIGAVLVAAAVVRFCLLSRLLGMPTCKVRP